jgi:hypothetical protein
MQVGGERGHLAANGETTGQDVPMSGPVAGGPVWRGPLADPWGRRARPHIAGDRPQVCCRRSSPLGIFKMASGIEVAGLVLGAFPIVVSALEHYREGFETLQDWWRFRTEYLGFVHAVGVQSVLFSENLEVLLAQIIASDAEMDSLLQDPGGDPWCDPTLEERMQRRLPKSYEYYRCTVDDINEVMDKLKGKLGIKNNKVRLPPLPWWIVREGPLGLPGSGPSVVTLYNQPSTAELRLELQRIAHPAQAQVGV